MVARIVTRRDLQEMAELWAARLDTEQIANQMLVPEHEVYNRLATIKTLARQVRVENRKIRRVY